MTFQGTLYPFQQEAVDMALERKRLLVAADLGLGKSVLAIAFAEHLFDAGKVNNVIIVCSSSLTYQWKRYIAQFTDNASTIIVGGTPAQRDRQYERIKDEDINYAIITYDQVWRDYPHVRRLPRDLIVLDEATSIKSSNTKRSKKVNQFHATYQLALSGQPIENRAEEVFAIMTWVDPDVLGRWDIFDTTFIKRNYFGGVDYYKNLPTLHKRLSTAMYRKRRDEPDVIDQLPKVTEELLLVSFDDAGAKLYRRIAADLMYELSQAVVMGSNFNVASIYGYGSSTQAEGIARGKIMSRLTCLRMLCDHPELLAISARRYALGQVGGSGTTGGSVYASELADDGLLETLPGTPKLDATLDLIDAILETEGNKIVLFSFFKPTLAIMQKALKVGSVQFTGDLNAKQRDIAKEQFRTDPACRVFLSSDAGGVGVDIPEANYLINFDLPWSSGKLEQRNGRIRRLSSEWKNVTVLNMLMAGSIEERQFEMLTQKKAIASAIIDGRGVSSQGRLNMTLQTLSGFLTGSEV